MEISEVFYPKNRQEWREWLIANHETAEDVWVRVFQKASGIACIDYDSMVEEALCFGWIDGIVKKYCEQSTARRHTPRRKNSYLSELNRQRIWKLQEQGLMTDAGLKAVEGKLGTVDDLFVIPDWIMDRMKAKPGVWETFQSYSIYYRRLKITWIADVSPSRREEAHKRLEYLVKMTAAGKQYGTNPFG